MKSDTNRYRKAYCRYIIYMLFILFSCKEGKRKQRIKQVVPEWIGKEILFPSCLPCRSLGSDTDCINLTILNFKIVLYINSLRCRSCRLRLTEWKKIITETDSLFSDEVDFSFYVQPQKRDERFLETMFRQNVSRHPVFIDTPNIIYRINKFPYQTEYQCLMRKITNNVLMIDNPSLNTRIWQFYKRYISERNKKLITGKKEDCIGLSKINSLSTMFTSILIY